MTSANGKGGPDVRALRILSSVPSERAATPGVTRRRGVRQGPRQLALVKLGDANAEARARATCELEQLQATAAPWLADCVRRILVVLPPREQPA